MDHPRTLVIFIDRNNDWATMEYVAELAPRADGSIVGRFVNCSEEVLFPFIVLSEQQKLYTHLPEHANKYRILDLKASGTFRLVSENS